MRRLKRCRGLFKAGASGGRACMAGLGLGKAILVGAAARSLIQVNGGVRCHAARELSSRFKVKWNPPKRSIPGGLRQLGRLSNTPDISGRGRESIHQIAAHRQRLAGNVSERLQTLNLLFAQAALLAIDDTQRANSLAPGHDQRCAGVEANVRCTRDQGVVGEIPCWSAVSAHRSCAWPRWPRNRPHHRRPVRHGSAPGTRRPSCRP